MPARLTRDWVIEVMGQLPFKKTNRLHFKPIERFKVSASLDSMGFVPPKGAEASVTELQESR